MADKKIVISGVDNFSSTLDSISKSQKQFTNESLSQSNQRISAIQNEGKVAEDFANKKKQLNSKLSEISQKEELDIERVLSKDKTFNQKREQAAKQYGANTTKYEEAISNEKLKAFERNKKEINYLETKYENQRSKVKDNFRREEDAKERKAQLEAEKRQKENVAIYNEYTKKQIDAQKSKEKQKYDLAQKKKKDRKEAVKKYGGATETGINASMTAMSGALSRGNAFGGAAAGIGGVASSMASLIPAIGGVLGTAISGVTQIAVAALSEARKQEVAAIKSRNLTGQGVSGGVGFMTTTELMEYTRATSLQRGMRGEKGELARQATMERKLGYDPNQLFGGINRFASLTSKGDSITSLTEKFLTVASASKLWGVDKKDFSMLGDVMKNVSTLMDREVQLFEEAKGDRSIMNMATFGKLGGAWANPNVAMARMQSIDASIRNPNNPFVDMLVKSSILKNKPNAGLMDLMDIQEQGIMNPETLGTMLKSVKSSYKGEEQHLALMSMFPSLKGSYAARESLLKNYDIFQGGMSSEQALAELGKRGAGKDVLKTIKEAGVTGLQESYEKRIYDELADIGKTLSKELLPLVRLTIPILAGIGKFLANPVKATKDALLKPAQKFADMITGEGKSKEEAEVSLMVGQVDDKFKNVKNKDLFIKEYSESKLAASSAKSAIFENLGTPSTFQMEKFDKSLEGMTKEMIQNLKDELKEDEKGKDKMMVKSIEVLVAKLNEVVTSGKFVTNNNGLGGDTYTRQNVNTAVSNK